MHCPKLRRLLREARCLATVQNEVVVVILPRRIRVFAVRRRRRVYDLRQALGLAKRRC